MTAEALPACPACGSSRLRALPVPGRWIGREVFEPLRGRLGLCLCRACGLRFTNPRPDPVSLGRFYSGDTYVCHDAGTEDSTRGSGHLLPLLGAPGRLLDFGCGAGAFLAAARAAGWDAVGYEPGDRGRATCERQGLAVEGSLAALPPRSFDALTAIHVFEHVPNLRATLADFGRLLRPGGRLCVEVPNATSLRARISRLSSRFDERYRAFPIHLSYFTPGSLRQLLASAGWADVRVTTVGVGLEELVAREPSESPAAPPSASPPPSPRPASRGGVRRLLRGVFMRARLGENIVAVARRPNAATA